MPFSSFFFTYTYLAGSLSLAVLALVGLGLFKRQRKPALISGLLSLPCGLYAVVFVPDYWNPVQIFRWFAGPEDFIFSFGNGCLVWIFATLHFPDRFKISTHPKSAIKRYLLLNIIFNPVLFSGPILGMRTIDSFLVATAVILILILKHNHSLWRICVSGAAGFTIFYWTFTALLLGFHPDFVQQWNLNQFCGISLLQVPLEEILWAVGFGATWPAVIAYLFNYGKQSR